METTKNKHTLKVRREELLRNLRTYKMAEFGDYTAKITAILDELAYIESQLASDLCQICAKRKEN